MPTGARQAWTLSLDGSPELVELVPYSGRLWGVPSSFRVRAVEQPLELPEGVPRLQRAKTAAVGTVEIDGHMLAMTRTNIPLSIRTAIRRNVSGVKRSGPLGFLGNLVGGAGLGGGMAAAAQTTLAWLVYELSVDGQPSGAWVAKTVDGMVERWIWVRPGGALPDNSTVDF